MAKSQDNGLEFVTLTSKQIRQIIKDITSARIVDVGFLPTKSPLTTSSLVLKHRSYGSNILTLRWLAEFATQKKGAKLMMSRNYYQWLMSLTK